MSTMTVDGLISGMSTSSVIDQLIGVERMQQDALKTRLSTTQKAAAAYRSINTKFDALRVAADALTKATAWTPVKATSSAASVTTTVTGSAQAGSLTFNVVSAAATHSVVSATTWAATTDPSGYGSSLTVTNTDGTTRGTITIGGTGTLADTVAAINNDTTMGLTAAAVQVAPGQYRLQVTAKDSGAAKSFSIGAPGDFNVTTSGADAHLTVGTGPGAYDVSSTTNTFTGLIPGVTVNVSKPETGVTVSVASDPDAVAASVQGLIDAANAALSEIKKYSANGADSAAVLRGDYSVTELTGQVLSAISNAVGADGSASVAGIQLTRDGTVKFDKTTFLSAYAADPAKVQRVLSGTAASPGPDGVTGTADDIAAVPGVASRLVTLSTSATDATTGTLTLLAQGRDKLADDYQDRIDDWDRRLTARREALTRQFASMETVLGQLKSQSSWLQGQIGSLPTSA